MSETNVSRFASFSFFVKNLMSCESSPGKIARWISIDVEKELLTDNWWDKVGITIEIELIGHYLFTIFNIFVGPIEPGKNPAFDKGSFLSLPKILKNTKVSPTLNGLYSAT